METKKEKPKKWQNNRMTDTRERALLTYIEMGKERSLRALSKQIGIPLRTIEKWSIKYGWAKEIEKVGKRIKDEINEAINVETREAASQCKNIVKAAVAMMVNKLRAMNKLGTSPEMRWSDLDKMIRLQAELYGVLSQNQGVGVVINNNNNPLMPSMTGEVQILKEMMSKMDPYMRIEALKILNELGKENIVDAQVVDESRDEGDEDKNSGSQEEE